MTSECVLPDIVMVSAVLHGAKAETPDMEKVGSMSLNFSLDFEDIDDDKFALLLGAEARYVEESGERGDVVVSTVFNGSFTRNNKSDRKLEHFIAANMLYPSLRAYLANTLAQLNIDPSDVPLSVPSLAIEHIHSDSE